MRKGAEAQKVCRLEWVACGWLNKRKCPIFFMKAAPVNARNTMAIKITGSAWDAVNLPRSSISASTPNQLRPTHPFST